MAEKYPPNKLAVLCGRTKMVCMWVGGMSARAIAQETGTSVTTVYRWIRRWQKEGNVETKPRSGRPRTTTAEEDQKIVDTVNSMPEKSAAEVIGLLRLQCDPRTVQRRRCQERPPCQYPQYSQYQETAYVPYPAYDKPYYPANYTYPSY
ncbi:uncharacterized protein [Macrobrachium rosenbergii]|uniref:uncharacterized protein n=1 Tax=Macrobrachium rosenbergii TaxID=79674 RepID=UPI0034D39897